MRYDVGVRGEARSADNDNALLAALIQVDTVLQHDTKEQPTAHEPEAQQGGVDQRHRPRDAIQPGQ